MKNITIYEYFDFFDADDIRIKGTRVGIETILDEYINAMSPEEIAIRYPTLTLEQVYATITFYLRNKQEVELYLERWQNYIEKSRQYQEQHPSSGVKRLRNMKLQRQQLAHGVTA